MHSRLFLGVMVLGACLGGTSLPAAPGDDHVVFETTRSYAGRTGRPQVSEVWIAPDRMYMLDGVVISIRRSDLGLRWTMLQGVKKYLEEPLTATAAAPPRAEPPFRIQEYGFEYRPKYDWRAVVLPEETSWEGRLCRQVRLLGEDDYAEETRELRVSRDVPIDIGRYFARVVEPYLDEAYQALYRAHPDLKTALVVHAVTVQERPIGSPMTFTRKLVKVESVPPPASLYDLPEGLTRVKTFAELMAR